MTKLQLLVQGDRVKALFTEVFRLLILILFSAYESAIQEINVSKNLVNLSCERKYVLLN